MIMKSKTVGLKRTINALGFSIKGIRSAFKHEPAFRQEIIALSILFPIALICDVTNVEQILLIGSLLLVIALELINSAIESVVDRVSEELHELSGRAKDMGSASVFVAIILAVFVWVSILVF